MKKVFILLFVLVFVPKSAEASDYSSSFINSSINHSIRIGYEKDIKKYCPDAKNLDKCKKACDRYKDFTDDSRHECQILKKTSKSKPPIVAATPVKSPVVLNKDNSNIVDNRNLQNQEELSRIEEEKKIQAEEERKADFEKKFQIIKDEKKEFVGSQDVAIGTIQNRSKIKTFFIGTDYKNIGQLRSEIVRNSNLIKKLEKNLEEAITDEERSNITEELNQVRSQQVKIEDVINQNESTFSLFGWVNRLFAR